MIGGLIRMLFRAAPVVSKAIKGAPEPGGTMPERATPTCALVILSQGAAQEFVRRDLAAAASDALFPPDEHQLLSVNDRVIAFLPTWKASRASWRDFAERALRSSDIEAVHCLGCDLTLSEEVLFSHLRAQPVTERGARLRIDSSVRAALVAVPESLKSRTPYVSVGGPGEKLIASLGLQAGEVI